MNIKSAIIIFILVGFGATKIFAQNNIASHEANIQIPEIALLGLASNHSTDLILQPLSPTEAGNSINLLPTQQNQDLWLNYSSVIRDKNHRRKIVAFVQGEIPEGVRINVEASEATGSGKGKLGKPVGAVALSNQPSEIITDIGSCYTGKGSQNGHILNYRLEYNNSPENYTQIAQAETSINVVYTLTDLN